jgi:chromosome segregation ATPase
MEEDASSHPASLDDAIANDGVIDTATSTINNKGRSLEELSHQDLIRLIRKLHVAHNSLKTEKKTVDELVEKVSTEKEAIRLKTLDLVQRYRESQSKIQELEDNKRLSIETAAEKQAVFEDMKAQCELLEKRLVKLKEGANALNY